MGWQVNKSMTCGQLTLTGLDFKTQRWTSPSQWQIRLHSVWEWIKFPSTQQLFFLFQVARLEKMCVSFWSR